MMRELQRQRHRTKGVSLEVKGVGDAVEAALAGSEEVASGLGSTFTAEADSGEVDPNMLKYIEEQMYGEQQSASAAATAPVLDAEEAELYTIPTHLQGVNPTPERNAVEDSANRWLAGITEVSLGAESKMATIEATEAAKRAMMSKRFARQDEAHGEAAPAHKLTIPRNYNSNFHQHRREFAVAQSERAAAHRDAAASSGALAAAGGRHAMPNDDKAMGRFKSHLRKKN